MELLINGETVTVQDDGSSLLGVLRDQLGDTSVKDGCSPQGQCGCCTVLVDGKPRVACVTPPRRVRGRNIITLAHLDEQTRKAWGETFLAAGASQCGFCTPGIIMRLIGLLNTKTQPTRLDLDRALAAHMCRCTGWNTIIEAFEAFTSGEDATNASEPVTQRDLIAAAHRASIEGTAQQKVSCDVVLGKGGFIDDLAPTGAAVALRNQQGEWVLGSSTQDARTKIGKVQGRRSTLAPSPPLEVPPPANSSGWAATLQTCWVDPGYLEPDAAWACAPNDTGSTAICSAVEPGNEMGASGATSADQSSSEIDNNAKSSDVAPQQPLGNGGAFAPKSAAKLNEVANRLAAQTNQAIRVLYSREDTIRLGTKRPPVAIGINADGTGIARVIKTAGITEKINAVAPNLQVQEVENPTQLETSSQVRAAGWAEAIAACTLARGSNSRVSDPTSQGWAEASFDQAANKISVRVGAGQVLDAVVLRSYCIGAAHMAYSWVTSEGLAIDSSGEVADLTVRSLGVCRSSETPVIEVDIEAEERDACLGSDAVFAAVAAAVALELQASLWPHERAEAANS